MTFPLAACTLQGSENYIVLVTHTCFADRVVLKHDVEPNNYGLVSRLSSWKRVGNGSYVTAEVKVETGNVTIEMLQSDDAAVHAPATVGGFFFGMGPKKAYGASLGVRSNYGKQVLVGYKRFCCTISALSISRVVITLFYDVYPLHQSRSNDPFARTMEYRYTRFLFTISALCISRVVLFAQTMEYRYMRSRLRYQLLASVGLLPPLER